MSATPRARLSTPQAILIACIISLLMAGIPLAILAILYYKNTTPAQSFNAAAWQTNMHKRFTMINDLTTRKLLPGKDSNSVKALLGKAQHSYTDSTGHTRWHYDAGSEQEGLGLEFHYIEVRFANNRVTEVLHHTALD
jgi:hypothetical protein